MKKRNKKEKGITSQTVAPGINPEDSYGEKANVADLKMGEYTEVTRLVYDEYDPSGDEKD